jgi:hypothetical protein
MTARVRLAITIVAIAAAAFGAGYWFRDRQPMRADFVQADRCTTNWEGAGTCFVGDWAYGIPVHVDWTDGQGGIHIGSNPACLPPLTSVEKLRVAVGVVWTGSGGDSHVFQVDCAGHPTLTPPPLP